MDRFKRNDMPLIAHRLVEVIEGSYLDDGRVVLPHSGVRMKAIMEDVGANGRAMIGLWLDHPTWDRTFYESASGAGATQEDAVAQAILNVGLHVVHLIDHQVLESPDERFTTTWAGLDHAWSTWLGNITSMGGDDSTKASIQGQPYWNLLREQMLTRLGNQKIVYVKVTAAWFDDIIAEVRVNNVVSAKMTATVHSHIQNSWPQQAKMLHKQFFWIAQDDATYRAYPQTAGSIKSAVITAAKLFSEIWSRPGGQFPRHEWEDRLAGAIGDRSLALEIASLVPEIAASMVYQNLPVDEVATIAAGELTYQINTNQLASYAHLYEVLNQTWCREISEQTIREWISFSALGSALRQLSEKNLSPTDITNPISLTYQVGNQYELR